MYDHLDDPTPPPPDDGARAAVAHRAQQLQRRRRGLLLSSSSAAVILVVLLGVALSRSDDRASLVIVAPTATTQAPAPPTTSAAPTATVTATVMPTSGRPPRTGPSPSPAACTRPQGDCPDGRAGWNNGFTSCTPASLAPDGAGKPPVDGMVLTLALPRSAAAGADLHGTVTVTNNSTITVSFEVRQPRIGLEAGVVGSGGRSSTHAIDAEGSEAFQLAPGASDSVNVVAHTSSCGDTSQDAEAPLAAGSYQVGVTLAFGNAQQVGGGSASPSADRQVRPQGSWSVAQPLQIT